MSQWLAELSYRLIKEKEENLNIGVCGITGRNGQNLRNIISDSTDKRIIWGIYGNEDKQRMLPTGFSVYTSKQFASKIEEDRGVQLNDYFGAYIPDVVIDFSGPAALDMLLDFATERSVPLVLCSTGYTAEQLEKIREASEFIPVVQNYNTSMGANIFLNIIKDVAKPFIENGYDVGIYEGHHERKKDYPSGTALRMIDEINGARISAGQEPFSDEQVNKILIDEKKYWDAMLYGDCEGAEILDIDVDIELRNRLASIIQGTDEIMCSGKEGLNVVSYRAGNISGDHKVAFNSDYDTVTIDHHVKDRAVFADGALKAAEWVVLQEAGLFNMSDVLGLNKEVSQ